MIVLTAVDSNNRIAIQTRDIIAVIEGADYCTIHVNATRDVAIFNVNESFSSIMARIDEEQMMAVAQISER